MTKKPFVGQNVIANGLWAWSIDVCRPLSIPARGGFFLLRNLTDDHSRYGYVHHLRSDRGAPSNSVPWTPYEIWYGKPVSYKYLRVSGCPAYVKRLVGDKLESRSSLCRFTGYPKETVGYYFYDPAEQKIFVSRNAVFLEKGFPSDNQRDEGLD
ncbi:UNVERIFIED_CONTAM: hypothetical protein Sradi_7279700 [Sesamum radiatum]|uniref:Retroviral polymerase SH3-like domain-containing protein n=1 Tax=Sesamum radiatum TaxID=300843 RepID=A0AAW2IIW3_SESRA